MQVITDNEQLSAHTHQLKALGGNIAFVPTMGNLHAGHLALVRAAKHLATTVIVSIFVNPKQFAANEDLSAYPRTLEADMEHLDHLGADVVFTPSEHAIYPEGVETLTTVSVPGLTDVLCGASRPGHFDGVSTVVCKLLNVVSPDVAVFGEKDLQQLLLIQKMVRDLAMAIEIVGIPTVRADDGLALSSRNSYLTADERIIAPALYETLQQLSGAIKAGRRDYSALCDHAREQLNKQRFQVDYLEIRRCSDLMSADHNDTQLALFVAATLGSTRLIDNVQINLNPQAAQ